MVKIKCTQTKANESDEYPVMRITDSGMVLYKHCPGLGAIVVGREEHSAYIIGEKVHKTVWNNAKPFYGSVTFTST